ncbi:hypothetical protein [Paenibacillus aestuarii]|uniref:Uncharacterized protein n=1 Tax=Paenibacillus aestuarii TaxID=516965 RepID=A0ABW0KBY3_9BACL|nr:hypothetical protein [Paenibacillus aestuarii]
MLAVIFFSPLFSAATDALHDTLVVFFKSRAATTIVITGVNVYRMPHPPMWDAEAERLLREKTKRVYGGQQLDFIQGLPRYASLIQPSVTGTDMAMKEAVKRKDSVSSGPHIGVPVKAIIRGGKQRKRIKSGIELKRRSSPFLRFT